MVRRGTPRVGRMVAQGQKLPTQQQPTSAALWARKPVMIAALVLDLLVTYPLFSWVSATSHARLIDCARNAWSSGKCNWVRANVGM